MGSPVNNSRTVMVGDNLNSAIASTAIEEIIQDSSPQLGADLDCNGYDIQFDDGTGIEDDSGNKTLLFGKTVSATTYAKITNNATGTTGPLLEAAGETNVDFRLAAAGTGDVKVTTGGLRVTSDNEAISVGAGNDLALTHDGSNSTITGGVGKITVTPAAGSVLELDNSNCTVDNGSVQIAGDLDVDNISINGNTVSSTSGDLQLKAVSGSSITFQDDADDTKQLTLDFATIGSGAERTWTFPNSDGTLVGKDTTDTLTNKTLTAPVLNDPTFDVSAGVTAHTGSSQGDGDITSTFVEIATVGSTGDAVTLPAAAAGKIVIIANNGANSADVFPASGDKIDGGSANAALALAAGANRLHICQDGTDWDTIQGAGSGGLSELSEDGSPQLGGPLDCNSRQIQWSQGADVASNTALPVLTDGNYFEVTGTTTITSINTTGGVGTQIKLHFNGALTLTHDATDLVLPGGANITTVAGDEAEFIEYGSGDYRCTNYSRGIGFGKATIWVPSVAMYATTANGADAQQVVTTAPNRPELKFLDFDASTREYAQFSIAMPNSWNKSTITYQVFWSASNTNTDDCIWALEAVAVTDGDTADLDFGTQITSTDAGSGTIEDIQKSPESAALTVGGTPIDGDLVFFQIYRDAAGAHGTDDFTGDARLLGIKIFFTTDQETDN